MKLLIVGSGGREHALAEHLSLSPDVEAIYVAPGNPGMMVSPTKTRLVSIEATQVDQLCEFALENKIDLTVVGPEIALSVGIVDLFEHKGLKIFGPTQQAAKLESSKAFAKEIMIKAKIPTAEYFYFNSVQQAVDFIEKTNWSKMVVKCDGLASGKGVVVCQSKQQAFSAVQDFMVNNVLGFNVESLIIEELLIGTELSVFFLCHDEYSVFIQSACDHKRLLDDDLGPNTGGMGAYAPAPNLTDDQVLDLKKQMVQPLLFEMIKQGTAFRGILFLGLMQTESGFKVLEFNTRFGDPETQTILPLLDENLLTFFKASAENDLHFFKTLHQDKIKSKNLKSIHVVMAAEGYALAGQKLVQGEVIQMSHPIKSSLYFAGVKKNHDQLQTYGGRILGLTAVAENFKSARSQVYDDLKNIQFKNAHYRRDIGKSL